MSPVADAESLHPSRVTSHRPFLPTLALLPSSLRAPLASRTASRHHARFTVAEFHRLCELLPERRLELIDGEVLEVIAKGSRHTAVVHRLARTLTPLLVHRGYELRMEAPLDPGEHQEQEPTPLAPTPCW